MWKNCLVQDFKSLVWSYLNFESFEFSEVDKADRLYKYIQAKIVNIERFIFFSVINSDKYSDVPLVKLKLDIEFYLQESGIKYTIFYLGGFFQGLISQYAIPILEKQPIWVTGENTSIGYIDTSDIAKFTLRSLALKETECRKFPLVGRKNWNSQEIIQLCERLSGQSARITKIPISALIIFRQLMGFFEWGSNIAERLAFAELLATGEDFTGDMKETYQLFGFEENETATLEGYMQDYFGRILRKLKELSDEKEKSL